MGVMYVTDGSLDGLLTAFYTAFYTREDVDGILPGPPEQPDFTVQYRDIATCPDQAIKVMAAVEKKIGNEAMHHITMAWLSELPGCGTLDPGFHTNGLWHRSADLLHADPSPGGSGAGSLPKGGPGNNIGCWD